MLPSRRLLRTAAEDDFDFAQDNTRNSCVHERRNTHIYVGLAKQNHRATNILRYATPIRKFKIDNALADLKKISRFYSDLVLGLSDKISILPVRIHSSILVSR